MILNNKELSNVIGGAITSSMINAVARMINTMLDLGRTIGSALRYGFSKKVCK